MRKRESNAYDLRSTRGSFTLEPALRLRATSLADDDEADPMRPPGATFCGCNDAEAGLNAPIVAARACLIRSWFDEASTTARATSLLRFMGPCTGVGKATAAATGVRDDVLALDGGIVVVAAAAAVAAATAAAAPRPAITLGLTAGAAVLAPVDRIYSNVFWCGTEPNARPVHVSQLMCQIEPKVCVPT
jgi:hypothetical protein